MPTPTVDIGDIQEVTRPDAVTMPTAQPIDTSVSLPTQTSGQIWPSPDLAYNRAQKTEFGLGPVLDKDTTQLMQAFLAGNENGIRKQAASTLNFGAAQNANKRLVELASAKGAGLTADEVNSALATPQTDPATVIEQAFGTKVMSSLTTAASNMEDTVANDVDPKHIQNAQDVGAEITTKREYAITLAQNLEEQVSKQGVMPWIADIAPTMFQAYNEAQLRGVIKDALGSSGLGLEDSLEDQTRSLILQDTPEFKQNLDKIVATLAAKNKQSAIHFLHAVIGQSQSQKTLGNLFTYLMPLDIASTLKGGAMLARKVVSYNAINSAAKQIVKAVAESTDNVAAKVAEAAGDTSSAAKLTVSKEITDGMEGRLDPAIIAKKSLLTNQLVDANLFETNPGSLTKDQTNWLRDGVIQRADKFGEIVQTAQKVNRTPVAVAVREATEAVDQDIRQTLKTEGIMDISDFRWNSMTNTYHKDVLIGDETGNAFAHPSTAMNYARMRGFKDAQIAEGVGEGEFKYYVPKDAVLTVSGKPNPNFGSSVDAAGRPTFYADAANGIAVDHSVQPMPNSVPISVDTKGKMTFHPVLDETNIALERQGLGWYFRVTVPVNETSDAMRSYQLASKNAISAVGEGRTANWMGAGLNWLRGADDTLSFNESVQRKAATYSQAALQKAVKTTSGYLDQIYNGVLKTDPATGEALSPWLAKARSWTGKIDQRKAAKQFDEVLTYAQKAIDKGTGKEGYFFKTPGELQDHYMRFYNRLPSYTEHEAYFANVQLIEYDRVLSEIAEYRNRSRLGAMQHSVSFLGKDRQRISSDNFDAIREKEFPGGNDSILVMGRNKGDEKIYSLSRMPKEIRDQLKDATHSGEGQVLRIYAPDHYPLQKFSDVAGENRIRYVFSRDVETSELGFNHVDRRGGGHWEYDYDHNIKQAKVIPNMETDAPINPNDKRVFQNLYVGDRNLMPVSNRAMGEEIVGHLSEVQRLLKANDPKGARAYALANLGMKPKEVIGKFYPTYSKELGRTIPAAYSLDEPFRVVPKGKLIYDMDNTLKDSYHAFEDGTKSGSDANQFKVAYNQERDSDGQQTLVNRGTKDNPDFRYEAASLVNPTETMNRALNRSINSIFMDDYKIYAVEHWLREAEPFLKNSEYTKSAPFWAYHNAEFLSGAPKDKVWNLMSNKYKIDQFVGTADKFDTWVHGVTQELADAFYTKFGPEENRNLAEKAVTIVPLWALGKVKDPISFVRSVTFNAKLGLFAIPQFLVQAQTHANIWAISPKHGTAATFDTLLHTWARINSDPAILESLDRYSAKFGNKIGNWLEARRELDKTGFEHVAGEYANINDTFKHKFIKDEFGGFLRAGQIPFHEGERSVRLSAWYTAYREFREENPVGKITNDIRAEILQRADLLTVNMSRASNSVLHGGFLSLTTQFLSYQLRLGELFWGKRLAATTTERNLARMRMIGVNSALYGVPTAFGLSGLPIGDWVRQYEIDNGYVPGDNHLSTLPMEGAISWGIAMATGGGDLQKGNIYNIGDRFGSQGFTLLRSDPTWWKVLGGAGVSTFVNTIASLDGFARAMLSYMRQDGPDAQYKLTQDDYTAALGEISSWNTYRQAIASLQTGKLLSKTDQYVTDVSPLSAIFMAITGTQPQEKSDLNHMNNIMKHQSEVQKDALKDFIVEAQRAVVTMDTDPDQSKKYWGKAWAILELANYPIDKKATALAIAMKGFEARVKSQAYDLAFKNTPSNKQDMRLEQYRTRVQLDEKRNP